MSNRSVPRPYRRASPPGRATLGKIESAAGTLSPKRSAQINLEIIRDKVDEIVLVTDDEMCDAAKWLWFEMSQGVELAGAAALAAIRTGKVSAPDDQIIAAVVNGNGTAGIT